MWLVLICTAALVLAVLLYYHHCYSYFRRKGVKHGAVVPFFGSLKKIVFRQEHFVENLSNSYFAFPEERFIGRYEFTQPVIVLRDVELIKKVTIKDVEHFLDHRILINSANDPLFGRNLFSLKGQEWKDMRSTWSPAFTSSKIKHMASLIADVGDQMIETLKMSIKKSGSNYLDMDVKDIIQRYANDVIASCVFGLDVNSHVDRDNEFFTQVVTISTLKFRQIILLALLSTVPWLINLLKISFLNGNTQQFFRHLVMKTLQKREKQNINRPDMINLLLAARKEWTDDDLIAQAVGLSINSETASAAMSFLLYELAINPDVQDKLAQEIRNMNERTGGKFDYNDIQNMPYMNMVVAELLRLWPTFFLERVCIKDYNLGKPNDKATEDYIIRKGEGVQIPVWAIHRDPAYFPDPERFDPERFSDDNKHNINNVAYSPFGLGPRNCIGSRFALCELKIMAYKLLQYIEVIPGPKTKIPVEIDPNNFNMSMKGGHWLRLRVRS